MRTPTWEASPGALATLLNSIESRVLRMVDLYTVKSGDSVVARWSSSDRDIEINEKVYKADPIIERDNVRFVTGVEVDSLSVVITPSSSGTLINGVPILVFAARSGFDCLRIRVERAFGNALSNNFSGTILLFDGRVSEYEVTRGSLSLTIKSDLELLDTSLPRNLYQAGCLNVPYDDSCGLLKVEYTGSATGSSNVKRTAFPIQIPRATNDYFALGTVEFTSGENKGIKRTIKSSKSTEISLMAPLPGIVSTGDTFKLVRGCNRTQAMCNSLGNIIHFRGCPYIPKPETILSGT